MNDLTYTIYNSDDTLLVTPTPDKYINIIKQVDGKQHENNNQWLIPNKNIEIFKQLVSIILLMPDNTPVKLKSKKYRRSRSPSPSDDEIKTKNKEIVINQVLRRDEDDDSEISEEDIYTSDSEDDAVAKAVNITRDKMILDIRRSKE
jgi:hypothetical protein